MLKTAIAYEDITPKESVPLMGYGDRTHNSEGVHDPLFAYAWWLEPTGQEPLVWIVLDLCLLSVASASQLAQEISNRTGLHPDSGGRPGHHSRVPTASPPSGREGSRRRSGRVLREVPIREALPDQR